MKYPLKAHADFVLKDPGLLSGKPFVNGDWTPGSGPLLPVVNPANGNLLGEVATLSPKEVAQAIGAAEAAFLLWRHLPAKARGNILEKWSVLIETHVDDLARIMTLEEGKPLAEARGEVLSSAAFARWFAEEGKRAYGEIIPAHLDDRRLLVLREPVGVAAAITPWNFPCSMIVRKAAPALAAGCTVVLKPAEATPFSALALAELAYRAGFPAGAFNVVPGDPEQIGNVFTRHPGVRKISFTGSTRVGKLLIGKSAEQVQRVTLELGGNAPFLVFEDADLEIAVADAVAAKFRNAGQACIAVNRIYVHESLFASFVERFAEKTAALKVGNGLAAGSEVGPVITETAFARLRTLVDDAVRQCGKVAVGGKPHALARETGGFFFEPTVIVNPSSGARVLHEEIFGPLVSILPFRNDAEVLSLANDTEYGLAAYFYTQDIRRLFHVSEALQFGMVGVNTTAIASEAAPFGGVKASGIGREGGRHGIEDYLEYKTVWAAGL
ncbi:MAG: NAD-dependent succinate-semialdehyde dehydrogenase [Zoogloeaceae bacterium]|jgi:succinate-semialdehyde dehydrogenase/glutarate-semialdehyde dehydrogenase|nr:NAD-dependent succinate-semialdehyde dehydrogenase [Zoogloeaceae bacterium]